MVVKVNNDNDDKEGFFIEKLTVQNTVTGNKSPKEDCGPNCEPCSPNQWCEPDAGPCPPECLPDEKKGSNVYQGPKPMV